MERATHMSRAEKAHKCILGSQSATDNGAGQNLSHIMVLVNLQHMTGLVIEHDQS